MISVLQVMPPNLGKLPAPHPATPYMSSNRWRLRCLPRNDENTSIANHARSRQRQLSAFLLDRCACSRDDFDPPLLSHLC
jgi:hypothetical protein